MSAFAVDAIAANANEMVALGVPVVDQHGCRWLMISARWLYSDDRDNRFASPRPIGFTRSVDGRWWYGDRFNPGEIELTLVTSPCLVAALDAWELSVVAVDTDPTEPHGIACADEVERRQANRRRNQMARASRKRNRR